MKQLFLAPARCHHRFPALTSQCPLPHPGTEPFCRNKKEKRQEVAAPDAHRERRVPEAFIDNTASRARAVVQRWGHYTIIVLPHTGGVWPQHRTRLLPRQGEAAVGGVGSPRTCPGVSLAQGRYLVATRLSPSPVPSQGGEGGDGHSSSWGSHSDGLEAGGRLQIRKPCTK